MRCLIALALATAALVAGCGSGSSSKLPQAGETVELDPAELTTEIDNPYWPMRPGSRWIYREIDSEGSEQRVEVTVLERTKRIANGVLARVVHDEVTEDGEPVEITDDWYAQDAEGNVWYLGEQTAEYENGVRTSTKGSFEAGVDGAQAGIIVPAEPRPGLTYRQEYAAGEAEDRAEILGVEEQAEVPFGHFEHVVMTRDLNPLEPKLVELKFYARGVGPVLAVAVSGSSDREELVSYVEGR